MSLDVYLVKTGARRSAKGSGIFVRENGQTKEISREEWDTKFPDREPVVAKFDEGEETGYVYDSNITHNLTGMADAAGIYKACWRPEEIGIERAEQLVPILEEGLRQLEADPAKFRAHDASNGWGTYEGFVPWVREYLEACKQYPDAEVRVSR